MKIGTNFAATAKTKKELLKHIFQNAHEFDSIGLFLWENMTVSLNSTVTPKQSRVYRHNQPPK